MTSSPVFARIAGTAGLVLVMAAVLLGIRLRFAPPAGSYEVTVPMMEAGIGMTPGTAVKVRGVTVGTVIDVQLTDDARPVATLRLNPGTDIPSENLQASITPKTFFGEKQMVLNYPLEQFGQPPFIQDGDVLADATPVTEVEDVLESIQPVLDAVDPDDLAVLFDAAAALEGEGDNFARGLEVGADAAAFANETAQQTLTNARLLTSLANQLTGAAGAFDRLNLATPGSVKVLIERTSEISSNLDALSSFALTIALYLDVEEERLDAMFSTGDLIGAFLERNTEQVPSLLEGLRLFAQVQSRPSPFLDDGGIYAPFKVFLNLEELFGAFPFFGRSDELMGGERSPIIPFAIFTVICLLMAVWLAMALGNIAFNPDRANYTAEFDDVTGLIENDNVKVAGVTVGKVESIDVAPGGTAVVSFSVDSSFSIPSDSEVVVRWRDTFGLRFLYLEPGEGDPVDPGHNFPMAQTSAPTDIGVFLQNITPFIQSIDPGLQNDFLQALAESLIGREEEVREIIADGADLTEAVASRDGEIGRLLDNAQIILDAYANREDDLYSLVDSFTDITATLAGRNDTLDRAITALADVQEAAGRLIDNNDEHLRAALDGLEVVAAVLADNRQNLEDALRRGPTGIAVYHRVSAIGQWFGVRGTGASLDYNTFTSERGAALPPRDGSSTESNGTSLFTVPLTTEGAR